jgi:hypothetical protein
MSAALPYAAVGASLLAARQASAIGSFNQAVAERNATIAEQEAEAQKKLTTYNLNKFNQSFEKLQSRTRVSLLKSGVELSGTALKILQSNAEQAELQRNVIEYNGQVAEAKKLEEATFSRISGTLAKRQANLQALGYISQAGTNLMPKIPTFEAELSPTAEVGAVKTNLQVSPKDTLAGTLLPAAQDVTNYYIKEKEISNKVEGGELIAQAKQELFELEEKSKLESTPEKGISKFENGYKTIVDKYKNKAGNNYIQKYFQINVSASKPSYTSNILKKTRANMVSTRTNQVLKNVQDKISVLVDGDNPFDYQTIFTYSVNEYQSLVKDGLASENDFNLFKEKLPSLVEETQVREIGAANAAKAFLLLSNEKNFPNIRGEERNKIIREMGTLSELQQKAFKASQDVNIIEIGDQYLRKFGEQKFFGVSPEDMQNLKTGDEEFDNQLELVNDKVIKDQFSFDTNYNVNSDVIQKIQSGEITNTKTKFLLSGETESKSILERLGDGDINDKDANFLSLILTRSNNNTFKKEDQKFLQYFNNLTPLLQGNTFLSFFDKEYNFRASQLRQVLHKRYVDGLREGIPIEDLLNATSKNYIAKDIKSYLPKTADLNSILDNMVNTLEIKTNTPQRKEGETIEEYELRISGGIDIGEDASP